MVPRQFHNAASQTEVDMKSLQFIKEAKYIYNAKEKEASVFYNALNKVRGGKSK